MLAFITSSKSPRVFLELLVWCLEKVPNIVSQMAVIDDDNMVQRKNHLLKSKKTGIFPKMPTKCYFNHLNFENISRTQAFHLDSRHPHVPMVESCHPTPHRSPWLSLCPRSRNVHCRSSSGPERRATPNPTDSKISHVRLG